MEFEPLAKQRRTWRQYVAKYFMEGQALHAHDEEVEIEDSAWDTTIQKYRKYVAFLVPFCAWQCLWWMTAVRHDFLSLYARTWPVMLTSTLACTVAGMTSEGAGAVFFPVMTLLLHVGTEVSRDFSVMCQSFGMTSALFVIVYSGVRIESRAVLLATVGAVPGMVCGFEIFDRALTPPQKKMIFVSVWGSFAIALYMLNAERKRKTFTRIPDFRAWKALILVACGFTGGVFTALTGSGVDVAVFSALTSLFRISEKIATPTTVVLMGINTVFAFFYRGVIQFDISAEAWEYTFCVIPICTTFAPLGSAIGTHFHRQVLACLLYLLEFVSVIGFVISGPSWTLCLIGALIIACGFVFFHFVCKMGYRLMDSIERELPELASKRPFLEVPAH